MVGGMITTSTEDITAMVRGYLSCAVWTATDEDGDTLSKHVGSGPRLEALGHGGEFTIGDDELMTLASFDTFVEAVHECVDFVTGQDSDLAELNAEQVGHDFWLTRNGHGAGFWDRGLGEAGGRLSDAAKAYGEASLEFEHNGRWYLS